MKMELNPAFLYRTSIYFKFRLYSNKQNTNLLALPKFSLCKYLKNENQLQLTIHFVVYA
jgi:hypothetical protein